MGEKREIWIKSVANARREVREFESTALLPDL